MIERVGDAARFIRLTTRTGTAVYLSDGAIASVRSALPRNVPGTEIVVSGQYQHGMETVGQVEALFG